MRVRREVYTLLPKARGKIPTIKHSEGVQHFEAPMLVVES
jgi:hypothetical protein